MGSGFIGKTTARGEKYSPLSRSWFCRACTMWHPDSLKRHLRNGEQYCDKAAYEYDMLQAALEALAESRNNE